MDDFESFRSHLRHSQQLTLEQWVERINLTKKKDIKPKKKKKKKLVKYQVKMVGYNIGQVGWHLH